MAKNYVFSGSVLIFAGILSFWILLRAIGRWREKRSKVALNLSLFLTFLVTSLILYDIAVWVYVADPYLVPFKIQVMLYTFVQVTQIIGHFFIFKLTDEVWEMKKKSITALLTGITIFIVAYLITGSLMDWGYYTLEENNFDLILPSYLIYVSYYALIEIWGAYLGLKTWRRLRQQYEGNRKKTGSMESERREVDAMLKISGFYVGLFIFNLLLILNLVIPTNALYYTSFLILPFVVSLGYQGFFPGRKNR